MKFNKESEKLLFKVLRDFKGKRGILIEALHKIQETFGYIPKEGIPIISEELSIPISEIYGVITFYNFFTTTPPSKYEIKLCFGTACYVKGAEKVLKKLKEILGVDVGITTPDGLFSVQPVRCLGACSLAPAMLVGDELYGKLLEEGKIESIINEYRARG